MLSLLLAEDNPGDVRLVREALRTSPFASELVVASDGAQALKYLRSSRFDLAILDLNLPKLSGLDVLKRVKEIEVLRQIPIIVLSTSGSEADILAAYDLHANAYLVKAHSYDAVVRQFEKIEAWLNCVKLPFNVDDYQMAPAHSADDDSKPI